MENKTDNVTFLKRQARICVSGDQRAELRWRPRLRRRYGRTGDLHAPTLKAPERPNRFLPLPRSIVRA